MKALLILTLLITAFKTVAQSDTMVFKNPREMLSYAYSKTDFNTFPSNFFSDFTIDLKTEEYEKFFTNHYDTTITVNGKDVLKLFGFFEWWDMKEKFKRDSVFFPILDRVYSYSGNKSLHLPIVVADFNILKLKKLKKDSFLNHQSKNPFDEIQESDLLKENITFAGFLFDTLGTKDVYFDFDEKFIFSNNDRNLIEINILYNNNKWTLLPGESVSLNEIGFKKGKISFQLKFDDNLSMNFEQKIFVDNRNNTKSLSGIYNSTYHTLFTDQNVENSIDNPEVHFTFFNACEDSKLRKPFIIVSGWGPHTDNTLINDQQEWPSNLYDLATQFNQEGLIEDLHSKGFDVVVVKFFPPNASVLKNANLMEKVISYINQQKLENDSFEENVIMGMSAGALATRLALQQMEKKHLEENGPHPHTKLFISNDGENLGANIPLGLQHTVEYLFQYEYTGNFTLLLDLKNYALHYILNAPLSKELLYYFHSETGSENNPGQGPSPSRLDYLNVHDLNNHSKNGHLSGYPSFQRNVSISNGSSTPSYNSNDFSCNHYPYPQETGSIFLKQEGLLKRYEATFLKHGIHRVFYFENKFIVGPWVSLYEAKTSNPLVLDNAPGGIIFIDKNPLVNVVDLFGQEVSGTLDIEENHLFSFTPTILTHDVRNLTGNIQNGYPNYNFKKNLLMYDNEYEFITGSATDQHELYSSNFFGYPHIGYPFSHYDYTPFDALFTWNQNTEHLIGNVKNPSAYEGMYSIMKPVLKNFIVEEAEPWNIFLQNKRIGFYARSDYQYYVDYEAKNGIYMGNHVTQKTDFKDFNVESNSVVDMQAEKEIIMKEGVHVKSGSNFHAYIGETTCAKSSFLNDNESTNSFEDDMFDNFSNSNGNEIILFPNPTKHEFNFLIKNLQIKDEIEFHIFDVKLNLLQSGRSAPEKSIDLNLSSGLYIVKFKINDEWYSKKLIIE